MAIVYVHRRKDNRKVFYIGIGKNKNRAFTKNGRQRNPHWHRIVNKYGFYVKITHSEILWEEACVIEKYLIAFWRERLGKRAITNIVDGGDGVFGLKMSDDAKEKMRNKKLGTIWSQERKERHSKTITEAYKNPIALENKRKGRIGTKLSDEAKRKVSIARSGANNASAKKVKNTETGEIFDTITFAARSIGMEPQNLQRRLTGYLKNNTPFVYA